MSQNVTCHFAAANERKLSKFQLKVIVMRLQQIHIVNVFTFITDLIIFSDPRMPMPITLGCTVSLSALKTYV